MFGITMPDPEVQSAIEALSSTKGISQEYIYKKAERTIKRLYGNNLGFLPREVNAEQLGKFLTNMIYKQRSSGMIYKIDPFMQYRYIGGSMIAGTDGENAYVGAPMFSKTFWMDELGVPEKYLRDSVVASFYGIMAHEATHIWIHKHEGSTGSQDSIDKARSRVKSHCSSKGISFVEEIFIECLQMVEDVLVEDGVLRQRPEFNYIRPYINTANNVFFSYRFLVRSVMRVNKKWQFALELAKFYRSQDLNIRSAIMQFDLVAGAVECMHPARTGIFEDRNKALIDLYDYAFNLYDLEESESGSEDDEEGESGGGGGFSDEEKEQIAEALGMDAEDVGKDADNPESTELGNGETSENEVQGSELHSEGRFEGVDDETSKAIDRTFHEHKDWEEEALSYEVWQDDIKSTGIFDGSSRFVNANEVSRRHSGLDDIQYIPAYNNIVSLFRLMKSPKNEIHRNQRKGRLTGRSFPSVYEGTPFDKVMPSNDLKFAGNYILIGDVSGSTHSTYGTPDKDRGLSGWICTDLLSAQYSFHRVLIEAGYNVASYAHTTYGDGSMIYGIGANNLPLFDPSFRPNTSIHELESNFNNINHGASYRGNADGFVLWKLAEIVRQANIIGDTNIIFFSDGLPAEVPVERLHADEHYRKMIAETRGDGIDVWAFAVIPQVVRNLQNLLGKDRTVDLSGTNLIDNAVDFLINSVSPI